jgi:DNA-binding transcriptional MocR family regulator
VDQRSVLIVAKEVLADKRISATAKLLLAQLLDHRNKKTGQCNPTHDTLAEELGTNVDKVQRAMAELYRFGFVQAKKGQRGCRYEISAPQICGTDAPGPYMNLT